MSSSSVINAQAPLRLQYKVNPEKALVTDRASTCSEDNSDPFHATVYPMPSSGESLPVGVHQALGGLHEAPTPGDILCAAMASCLDSSLRMVANAFGISLVKLTVDVTGEVDVRGTMMIDPDVPVGFQHMACTVKLQAVEGTDPAAIGKLCKIAEHCCVILQTLQHTPSIQTHYVIDNAAELTTAG